MAPRNKRVFISDVHISHIPRLDEGRYDYTWLQQADAAAFASFLLHLRSRADVEEVVFIGDLFDDWVIPVDVAPPSFDDIITSRAAAGDPVIGALRALCQDENIRVVCLTGNHDMGLTKEVVERQFPGMAFGGNEIWNSGTSAYGSSRLRAEHGSAHALFNAPDPENNPGSRLPLGYYISRVAATKMHRTGSGKRHWWTYVDDLVEKLGPEKIASCVFRAVLEEAKLAINTPITMPPLDGKSASITAGEVAAQYADLYSQWKEQYGQGLAFKSILAEIGYLDDVADRLCKKNDANTVILGHSHGWELDKDCWFVDDRIHANCGTWCDTADSSEKPGRRTPRTYVEVETSRELRRRQVRVKEWKDTEPGETLKEEEIDL